MGNWLRNLVIRFIMRCVPKRGKRIIYNVLCYSLITKAEKHNQMLEELSVLNKKLKLTSDTRGLEFVLQIKDVLLSSPEFSHWKKYDYDALLVKMPYWLRYDTTENIQDDLTTILNANYQLA